MTGLIAAEYLKLRKRTFFWVLAGLIWALHAFASWLSFTVTVGSEMGGSGQTVNFPELIALVLAIQILGGEFSGGRWATALTRDSRRGAHLLAKASTALLGVLFIIAIGAAAGQVTAAVLGGEVAGLSRVVEDIAKGALVGLVWILIAFAFTALLRGVGASFIVGFIFFNADGLASLWDKYQPFSVNHNASLFFNAGGGLATLVIWAAAMATASWALVRFRDA